MNAGATVVLTVKERRRWSVGSATVERACVGAPTIRARFVATGSDHGTIQLPLAPRIRAQLLPTFKM